MATLQQVKDRCAKLGCELEDAGDVLEVFAPEGNVVTGTGTHSVCIPKWNDDPDRVRKPEKRPMWAVYTDVLHDLEMGVQPCEDSLCDVCHDGG